jgi:redox-sensitive bicupin YhaK (pirin superfamily)
MGAGYHSHPGAATILLYFQGVSSRQADSTAAQNALRNGHVQAYVNDLDPLRPTTRKAPGQP